MTQSWSLVTVALTLFAGVVGCASTTLRPAARIGSAETAVEAARRHGAEDAPASAIHLRLAQDQIALARRSIEEGELERAEWLLVRAEADAAVAAALSREAESRRVADTVATSVREAASAPEKAGNGR